MHSLVVSICDLNRRGYDVQLDEIIGDCYICQARNKSVDNFLKSDCSDMIFIDADLCFEKETLWRLMRHEAQIVGGLYRHKLDDTSYPINIQVDEQRRPLGNKESGLVSAWFVPTGLMRINRSVFDLLMEKHPEFQKKDKWDFFKTGYLFGDDAFFGEDTAFCRYCKDVGVEIWCEPRINTGHTGWKTFFGNYHEFLSNLPMEGIRV